VGAVLELGERPLAIATRHNSRPPRGTQHYALLRMAAVGNFVPKTCARQQERAHHTSNYKTKRARRGPSHGFIAKVRVAGSSPVVRSKKLLVSRPFRAAGPRPKRAQWVGPGTDRCGPRWHERREAAGQRGTRRWTRVASLADRRGSRFDCAIRVPGFRCPPGAAGDQRLTRRPS
jgi:hypothetical protein